MNIFYKKISFVLFLVFFITGCVNRPAPLPESHSQVLPWGALDLDINNYEFEDFLKLFKLNKKIKNRLANVPKE